MPIDLKDAADLADESVGVARVSFGRANYCGRSGGMGETGAIRFGAGRRCATAAVSSSPRRARYSWAKPMRPQSWGLGASHPQEGSPIVNNVHQTRRICLDPTREKVQVLPTRVDSCLGVSPCSEMR